MMLAAQAVILENQAPHHHHHRPSHQQKSPSLSIQNVNPEIVKMLMLMNKAKREAQNKGAAQK